MEGANAKQDLTWFWITLAAVAIIGFFIFRQSIAPVKTAPITLVPSGSQQAYNPNSYNPNSYYDYYPPDYYYQPTVYPGDQAAWASSDAQSNQAYAQSQQNIAIANAAADVLTSLSDGIFGGGSN